MTAFNRQAQILRRITCIVCLGFVVESARSRKPAPAFLTGVRTDGGHNLDASIFKNFPMAEHKNLRIEFAAYNVTNSVQLGYPSIFWNRNPAPANVAGFGEITSAANTPRHVQVAAKFSF